MPIPPECAGAGAFARDGGVAAGFRLRVDHRVGRHRTDRLVSNHPVSHTARRARVVARFTAIIVPFAQVGAAVLLVVVATLVTAGWRLGVRGVVFGLRGRRQWIGWVMVAILVI